LLLYFILGTSLANLSIHLFLAKNLDVKLVEESKMGFLDHTQIFCPSDLAELLVNFCEEGQRFSVFLKLLKFSAQVKVFYF
jgi:hypothetical protein